MADLSDNPPQKARDRRPRRVARPWAWWPLRVAVSIEMILIFDQAVFAGRFLGGDYDALKLHQDNATYTGVTILVEVLMAIVLRWPGRGPLWPVFLCLGMFALVGLQIIAGYARLLALHIPLGVSLIAGTVLLLIWVWKPHRTPAENPGTEPDGGAEELSEAYLASER